MLNKKDYQTKFGDPLKELLLKRFKKIKFAAEILGVNQNMLSHYFNGRRTPNQEFEDLCRRHGLDMDIFSYLHQDKELPDFPADARGLTWNQVVWYVMQLKDLVEEKNKMIERQHQVIKFYEQRVKELQRL